MLTTSSVRQRGQKHSAAPAHQKHIPNQDARSQFNLRLPCAVGADRRLPTPHSAQRPALEIFARPRPHALAGKYKPPACTQPHASRLARPQPANALFTRTPLASLLRHSGSLHAPLIDQPVSSWRFLRPPALLFLVVDPPPPATAVSDSSCGEETERAVLLYKVSKDNGRNSNVTNNMRRAAGTTCESAVLFSP